MQTLKPWTAPKLTTHGKVEAITNELIKAKKLGMADDFGVSGVADAEGYRVISSP
jgi:hypothetical protein